MDFVIDLKKYPALEYASAAYEAAAVVSILLNDVPTEYAILPAANTFEDTHKHNTIIKITEILFLNFHF